MKEKKARVEDAMHATKAAVEEGIVPGGGVALLRAIEAVEKAVDDLSGDEKIGARIVVRALEEPTRQIVANAGAEGSVVINELKAKGGNFGYNANSEKVEDMVKAGIIDPTKVTKNALQNAASIAGLMLTTEALVSEIKEKEKAPAGDAGAAAAWAECTDPPETEDGIEAPAKAGAFCCLPQVGAEPVFRNRTPRPGVEVLSNLLNCSKSGDSIQGTDRRGR